MSIVKVSLTKYRAIAHDSRRSAREKEFSPHDEVIAKQIPGKDAQQAEAARQAIRDRYALMQEKIDQAKTPDELKRLIPVVE